ncbi:hypothetical protein OS493_015967 [Desmophyllum pertusum]|uniref:Major facilitator superfamily (MFS) profile domain-containing protein n=1 Tax=Desmophyllum pertusum TaxID=174260 RepID=A0A9W9YCZ8_9CNID|nr:hypothetical protein OS493_015967 [Desmophyllum pertusum]
MAANSMEENSNFETNATEESCEALVNRNYNGSINSQVKQNENYSVQFDDILKSIGEFGSWQKIIYFLTCVFVLVPSVTEYNLICKRAFIAANVQAGFGAGMLVGSFIFGAISDIYGRRFCMLLCSLLTTLFSLGAAFSHSLVLFTLLRFGTAASLTGFYVAHYVYILELVGPSYRTMVAKCAGLFWAIGSGTVTLLAYYIRDWRTLLLVASCPPALFICLWPILPESARWLLVRGRSDEARLVVMKYVKKSSMPSDYLSSALSRCGQGAADVHTTK